MQVFVAGLLTLAGLPILLGGPQPGSLSEALPAVLVYAVAAVFTGGGAATVTAAAMRNPVTALYFEIAAAPPLALASIAYASGALALAGGRAAVSAAIFLGLAGAFVTRTVAVYRTMRDLQAELGRQE